MCFAVHTRSNPSPLCSIVKRRKTKERCRTLWEKGGSTNVQVRVEWRKISRSRGRHLERRCNWLHQLSFLLLHNLLLGGLDGDRKTKLSGVLRAEMLANKLLYNRGVACLDVIELASECNANKRDDSLLKQAGDLAGAVDLRPEVACPEVVFCTQRS